MKAWLPLSPAILEMTAHRLPSPTGSSKRRVHRLMPAPTLKQTLAADDAAALAASRKAVSRCDASEGSVTTAFISKMLAVPARWFTESRRRANGGASVFLGFGRVYSGALREGDVVYVINGAYDPSEPDDGSCEEIVVEELYLMMGQGMFRVKEVPAGNILAVGGLDRHVLKSATLSSSKMCAPFGNMMFQVAPIVKVAVEPESVADMPALVEGLRLLNRSDAFVEVGLMETGEHVIAAAGEVRGALHRGPSREVAPKSFEGVASSRVLQEGVSTTGSATVTTSNGLLTIKAAGHPCRLSSPCHRGFR